MKQFPKILNFELRTHLKNKLFVGMTLVIVAALAILLFFPRIQEALDVNQGDADQAIPHHLRSPCEPWHQS